MEAYHVLSYIGLNPLHTKNSLVTDPKDYHFCAYAQRLSGNDPGNMDDEFMRRCSYMSKSISIGSEIYVRDKIERFEDATHWRREHHPLQPEGIEDMYYLYLPSR